MHSDRPRLDPSAPAEPSAKKAKGAAAGHSGKALSPAGASVKKAEEPRKNRHGEPIVTVVEPIPDEGFSMDVGAFLKKNFRTLVYESDDGKEIIVEYPDGTVKRKPITMEDPE